MRNIELKAKLRDRRKAVELCNRREGFRFAGEFEQIDTYFRVSRGRFKLRVCQPGETYLVYYERENRPDIKGCDYHIEFVDPGLWEILSKALEIVAEVKKIRTLYLWENVRIHLDRVEGLGNFLEFEAVLGEGDTEEEGFRKVEELKSLFEVGEQDLIEGSYLEMVLTS